MRYAKGILIGCAALAAAIALASGAAAQPVNKAYVADKIRKVEDGVDQFRDYLKRRDENARPAAGTAQSRSRRARGRRRSAPTESQEAALADRKDELEDALDDLNRSTNRLRRKFRAADQWTKTRIQVERVLDDARKINQVVARGRYGSEVARLWAALRTQINELARAYGLTPLGA